MSKLTKLTLSIAAVATIATLAANQDAAARKSKSQEKCYGIVKKGQNDCASADGKHSCAGQATENASSQEWVLVPKGLCNRINGGKTSA